MPASSPRSGQNITFQLPRSSLKIAGIAFFVGLLLFFIVWLSTRHNNEFYRADPAQTDKQAVELAPLPEPLPAGSGASEMPDAKPQPLEEKPQLVETAPPPPPKPLTEVPVTPAPPASNTAAAAPPSDQPVPIPGQSPAPQYPPAALRRGESGTVVVRVDVDTAGRPASVAMVQRSSSRLLDRAAMEAVREWRFQPAQSNGQPIAGSLEIPFDFKPTQ